MSLEVSRLHLASLQVPEDLPPGQASDPVSWRGSLHRLRALAGARVHFCHHTGVIHN